MGYRSQVIVAFTDEEFKELLHSCDDGAAINILEGANIHHAKGWILLNYDWVKWYDGFPEVDAVNKYINKLQDEDKETYEFHRMGENYEDYDHSGMSNSPFEISMNRSLDFNV